MPCVAQFKGRDQQKSSSGLWLEKVVAAVHVLVMLLVAFVLDGMSR